MEWILGIGFVIFLIIGVSVAGILIVLFIMIGCYTIEIFRRVLKDF